MFNSSVLLIYCVCVYKGDICQALNGKNVHTVSTVSKNILVNYHPPVKIKYYYYIKYVYLTLL